MIVEKKVYILDITGVMHIFNADKEFKLIGEPKLGEYSACTPAFTNGRIYIRGEEEPLLHWKMTDNCINKVDGLVQEIGTLPTGSFLFCRPFRRSLIIFLKRH